MSQKIYTNLDIKGNATIGDIANATSDTDKFLVSDAGVVKYRTGSEMLSDIGVSLGTASHIEHPVKAGVAINKGQAVYVTSADGTNMIVGLASNSSEATSSKTMGLLNATVSANGFADVVAEGLLDGLNTLGATAGDPVWLGTNGNLIYGLSNKPYAPNHLVFIGIVTRVNANNGEIFVKVQNGFELNEIHDVDLKTTIPVNGHILGFDGTLWVNKTIASWLGYTPVPTTRTITINGNTQDLSSNLSFSIASGVTSFNTRTGAITLSSGDVTGALGYTPYNASNPSGYISSYTETDTLATVTARGASTSTLSTFDGGLNIGNAKLRWGSNSSPTLGFPFTGGPNAFWIDVNDGDTGGIAIDNDGTTIYGAGDSGHVFRVIDEDVYQATSNVDSSTTFRIQQGQNGGGYVRGIFNVTDYLLADNSARAPIFYDSNDTSYYSDLASTSQTATRQRGGTLYGPNTTWGAYLLIGGNGRTSYIDNTTVASVVSTDGNLHLDAASGKNMYFNWYDGGAIIFGNGSESQIGYMSSTGDFTANSSSRSPIFYDSNNTSYYVDAASTSRLNTLTLSALASDDGMIENNTGGYFHLGGWGVGRTAATAILVNTAYRADIADNATNADAVGGFSAGTFYRNLGFGSGYPSWDLNTVDPDRSGFTYANNGPYVGPFIHIGASGYGLQFNAVYNSGGYGLAFRTRNGDSGSWNTWRYPAIYGINANGGGDLYATVYYDQNNTGYYLDPASSSYLNVLDCANRVNGAWLGISNTSSSTGNGLSLYNGNSGGQPTYGIMFAGTSTFGTHGAVSADWATYFTMDSTANRGWIFRNINGVGNVASISNGGVLQTSGYMYSSTYVQAGNQMYSPIYYDANNTGYYVDPASTSNVVNIGLNGYINFNGSGTSVRISESYGILMNCVSTPWNVQMINTSLLVGLSASGGNYGIGNGYFTGDVTAYYSDKRLKHNLTLIGNAIEKVKSLNGYTYQHNELGQELLKENSYKKHAGLIAQEVQAVLPEVVTIAPFDLDGYDEQGNGISKSGENYLTIKYERVVPLLIEAIKEQQTQIEELKELVNQLIKK